MNKSIIIIAVVVILLVVIGGAFLISSGKTKDSSTGSSNINNLNSNTNTNTQNTPPAQNQPPAQAQPGTLEVNIASFAFSPTTLTINKGDSIKWTNQDAAPHTVTSDTGNELNSGTLSNGQTFSHTFNNAGTFDYHCKFHSMMKAKIIVQ